jgi:hypothetical protein
MGADEEPEEEGVLSKKKERAMEAAARQYRGIFFIVRRGVAKVVFGVAEGTGSTSYSIEAG